MRLSDVVSVDSRFEQSVNLMLDLNNEKKIEGYIPTRSSVNVLQTYINDILDTNGSRATTLIGPYGKGKSHLLLILLSLLRKDKTVAMSGLIDKVRVIDEKSGFSTIKPFAAILLTCSSYVIGSLTSMISESSSVWVSLISKFS